MSRSRRIQVLLALVLCLFEVFRYLHLRADFPAGVTDSAVVYTDEGIYSCSSVRLLHQGNWYKPGDFNSGVSVPLGEAIHFLTFRALGESFSSVRLSSAVASSLTVLFTGQIAAELYGLSSALLACILLDSNFVFFAYSRLGILEPIVTAFLMASLYCILMAIRHNRALWCLGAGLAASAAILTKPSVLFIDVVLFASLLLAFRAKRQSNPLLPFALLAAGCLPAVVVLIALKQHFAVDAQYFAHYNVAGRSVTGPFSYVKNIVRVTLNYWQVGVPLLVATVCAMIPPLRERRAFAGVLSSNVLLMYAALFTLSLAVLLYNPNRYDFPLVPVLAIASAAGLLGSSISASSMPLVRRMAWAAVVLAVGIDGTRIVRYLSQPTYSYFAATTQIGEILRRSPGIPESPALAGQVSGTVSLEANTQPLFGMGTKPLSARMRAEKPRFLVTFNDQGEMLRWVKDAGMTAHVQGHWRVLDNYLPGHDDLTLWSLEEASPGVGTGK